MSLTRSAVLGSAMDEEMEAVEGDGMMVELQLTCRSGGCGIEVDEDRRKPDTRLSRVLVPRVGGPRVLSS